MECRHGSDCPYLRDYLSQRIDEMEKVMTLAEAEIEKLRQENQS